MLTNYMIILVVYLAIVWIFLKLHDYTVKKHNVKTSEFIRLIFSFMWFITIILIVFHYISSLLKSKPKE